MKTLILIITILFSTSVFANRTAELDCLAKNIYFEARSESVLGQMAVAVVTLNRVKSNTYPSTICEVVWQPRQFSWTMDGKSDTPREIEAWKRSQAIADYIYKGYLQFKDTPKLDLSANATHYHAVYVQPDWSKRLNYLGKIDNHLFYEGY